METILGTVADIPSRTSDVIKLIQTIARQTFGQAFSKNTLYKAHYKYIWMKLIATKEVYDIVPATPITPLNVEYQVEMEVESAFEGSIFCVTNLPKINLKPIGGETWHSAPFVCSVNVSSCPPLVNEIDLDLDLDMDLKNIPFDLDSDPRFIEVPTTPALFNLDTNPRFPSIQPAQDDLITRPSHDRDKLIEPDPIYPDPIHRAHKKNDLVQLIDIDDREYQSTGVVCAIIGYCC